ncbi:MAG: hypothetical protein EOP87_24560 [Verrucomicrobiaceae bacterium]|nr:MAG: hypothetical protein EOP87_24560 [Verrucomicrobiaceae bacterium]
MAADHGPEEAARRYRAIVVTTLRQLRGLADSRLRLRVSPADADEAVRFWLLPKLAPHWQADGSVFRTEGWEIDFGSAGDENFEVQATGEILCPNLGARWVHAGLLGMGRTATRVIGPATGGGTYFEARAVGSPEIDPPRILPELPIIRTSEDWQSAMNGPLGATLKKAWEQEA